jgi:two-component system response regulator ResD
MNVHNKILIVDEDGHVRKLLRVYFEQAEFNIEEAEYGKEALYKAQTHRFSMVIMGWQLADISGDELCRQFRLRGTAPLIMLIGQTEEMGRIEGFIAGADDFITKPFSPREVVLRAKAMLARLTGAARDQAEAHNRDDIVLSSITIQPRARRVTVHGKEVHFTLKEYELFCFLAKHEGEVFTRKELLSELWGAEQQDFADSRTVDTHIRRVRHKLSEAFSDKNGLIQTIWGYGYMLSIKSM